VSTQFVVLKVISFVDHIIILCHKLIQSSVICRQLNVAVIFI